MGRLHQALYHSSTFQYWYGGRISALGLGHLVCEVRQNLHKKSLADLGAFVRGIKRKSVSSNHHRRFIQRDTAKRVARYALSSQSTSDPMTRSVQVVVATRWHIVDVLVSTSKLVPLTNLLRCESDDASVELACHQTANPFARLLYQVWQCVCISLTSLLLRRSGCR